MKVAVIMLTFIGLVSSAQAETGKASWYGPGFAGRRTACGQRFNPNALTAASKTHRCGSVVTVTNLRNHRSVLVTITDRGPFVRGRIIDLSKGAAAAIGMRGTDPVSVH